MGHIPKWVRSSRQRAFHVRPASHPKQDGTNVHFDYTVRRIETQKDNYLKGFAELNDAFLSRLIRNKKILSFNSECNEDDTRSTFLGQNQAVVYRQERVGFCYNGR